MNKNELPFWGLFLWMRERVKPQLELQDYHLLLLALGDNLIADMTNLPQISQVCQLLWLKTCQADKVRKFYDDLSDYWHDLQLREQSINRFEEIGESSFPQDDQLKLIAPPDSSDPDQLTNDPDQLTKVSKPPTSVKEIPLAIKTPTIPLVNKERFQTDREYSLTISDFPVTSRQMQRFFNTLRLRTRCGKSELVDLNATVKKISEEGIFLEPVWLDKRVNRVELLLLIDASNSMIPFHIFTAEIVKTIEANFTKFESFQIYYFRNCPQDYVYLHPQRPDYLAVDDLIKSLRPQKTVVFIISDAGAARGGSSPKRIDMTREFLEIFAPCVRKSVWLNPLPSDRWSGNAAARIAQLIDMFELSPWGVKLASKFIK